MPSKLTTTSSHASRITHHPRRRIRRAMGLIEMLVALIIAAALLTATAVAVDSSFRGYAINQQQASLMHQARVTVHRIATTIRLAHEHAPEDATLNTQFKDGQTVTGTAIAMFDEAGEDLTFKYDAPNKRVLAIYNGTQRVLCSGVEAFTVRMEPKQSETNKRINDVYDLLDTATILLTVRTRAEDQQSGEASSTQTVTLSAAIRPRRNSW